MTLAGLGAGAQASDWSAELHEVALPLAQVELSFQPPDATAPGSAESAPAQVAQTTTRSDAYGRSGSRWWTFGGLYANDFDDAQDVNLHVAFSEFLADDLEFAVEAAGWYFDQPGGNTGGVSGSMVFRWHALHAEDYRWTLFGDAGIGLLGAFDDVPSGGTGFNFLPRLGGGLTWALNESVDGASRGPRLMVGVRWHHISNARIQGDDNNPGRDSVAGYVALTIPF